VGFLSNTGLSLPGFGALLSLSTKYLAANNESIYMQEFAILSKTVKHVFWVEVQGFSIFQDRAVKTHHREAAPFSSELSVSPLSRTVSGSLHLCGMIVKQYKILIACSLTWVPVFHTL